MKNISHNVSINEFVRRQIKGSGKSYTKSLSFENIASHAEIQFKNGNYTQGYRDGVIIINVANNIIHKFICPFVEITDKTKLKANITRRRPEEEAYIQIRALNGTPLKTGSVELILYHHDVLIETNENSSDTEWELISFHAIPENINHMPMGPVTMMRNQLRLQGGTKAFYKSIKWAESVNFWQKYAVLDDEKTNNYI